ncbi:MAG TPA: glycosyltransferase [Blastocatellia bacterium]|nr:glycosyltransferase [Blastocatellia bacterium]
MNSIIPHIGLVCFIADPFDPPGHERFGGGHLFLFDLGRFLVQSGYRVTFFTRLNSKLKKCFDALGPLCSIYRLEVGPAEELPPTTVGLYLDDLSSEFNRVFAIKKSEFTAVHSHYWIAGEVVRRFCLEYPTRHVHSVLSLGRLNHEKGEPITETSALREECEVRVFNAAEALLTVCPSEYEDLRRLYPEVDLSRTYIIPYGVDPDVFYPRPQSERDFVRRKTFGFTKGPEPIF